MSRPGAPKARFNGRKQVVVRSLAINDESRRRQSDEDLSKVAGETITSTVRDALSLWPKGDRYTVRVAVFVEKGGK